MRLVSIEKYHPYDPFANINYLSLFKTGTVGAMCDSYLRWSDVTTRVVYTVGYIRAELF